MAKTSLTKDEFQQRYGDRRAAVFERYTRAANEYQRRLDSGLELLEEPAQYYAELASIFLISVVDAVYDE